MMEQDSGKILCHDKAKHMQRCFAYAGLCLSRNKEVIFIDSKRETWKRLSNIQKTEER